MSAPMRYGKFLFALPMIAAMTARADVPPPVSGDIVFTELMIAPGSGSTHEYIEIYSRAAAPVSLEGCILIEGSTGTCTINGMSVPGNCYALKGANGALSIDPASYQFFALNGATYQTDCGVAPTADYNTLSLNNSGAESLQLYCSQNGTFESVAQVTYQWDKVVGATTGHSWMLNQAFVAGGDATSAANWCVAPIEDVSCTYGSGALDYGTPGLPNNCAAPIPPTDGKVHPGKGDVIFSELEIWPSTAPPEWVELFVKSDPGDGTKYDLNGCQLRQMDCDNPDSSVSGEPSLTDEECLAQTAPVFTATAPLSPEGGSFPLTVGEEVLLVSGTQPCVSYDETGVCQVTADVSYSSSKLSLYSTDTRMLELSCPDSEGVQQTVDRMIYRKADGDAECKEPSGHCSWELRAAAFDADLNDDPANWGASTVAASYLASYSDTAPVSAYGTPKAGNVVGPRVYKTPLQPGDIVLSELGIWPSSSTTSPDWMELQVVGIPAVDTVFDVGQCVLRSYTCPDANGFDCIQTELADDAWGYTSKITPTRDDLIADGPAILLFGSSSSRQTIAVDAEGNPVATADGIFSASAGLSNTGTRMLELACPGDDGVLATVDRVVYNKAWVDEVCDLSSLHCSWALRSDQLDTDSNDSPVNWTAAVSSYLDPELTPARGTPGEVNTAPSQPATARHPREGEVAFSEMMISAAVSTPEWFELQGVSADENGVPLELGGCQVLEEATADIGVCSPDAPGECIVFPIPDILSMPVAAGQRRLFVKSKPCVSYGQQVPTDGSEATCLAPADLKYSSLDFHTSALEAVSLWCPAEAGGWTLVDRFRYNWDDFTDQCPKGGDDGLTACSLAVHQGYVNAADNDNPFFQCVSPVSGTYYDLEGGLNAGTPGDENDCPDLARVPAAHSIRITEVMFGPNGDNDDLGEYANEWLELYNGTSEPLDLKACSFVNVPVGADGSLETDKAKSYSQAANPVTIGPGMYQVWIRSGCMFGGTEGCDFPTGADSSEETYPLYASYSGLSLSDSSVYELQLWCSGEEAEPVLVDAVQLDPAGDGLEKGHSWQLSPEKLTSDEPYDRQNWCAAGFDTKFYDTDKGGNYGTPGMPNKCPEPLHYDGAGPGCRCDSGEGERAGTGQAALGLLALLGLVAARRRS